MINCPCCTSTDTKLFIRDIVKDYNLVKCNSCNVVFADPFREPPAEFYTNAMDVASNERHFKIKPFPKSHPATKCPELKGGQGKTLLDLGCGNGAFIALSEQNGFNCYGLDIDKTSISAARSRNLKATFENGFLNDLERFSDFPKQFDVITMFEVFEHIDNPVAVIKKIKNLLKDDGYFIGSLPNIERYKMWTHNMDYERPPYHLTYWTTSSWKTFIENNGFKLVTAKNNNYYGYISDVFNYRSNKNRQAGLLKSLTHYFFGGTKYFIEGPIEKVLEKGAGFFFVLKNSRS